MYSVQQKTKRFNMLDKQKMDRKWGIAKERKK